MFHTRLPTRAAQDGHIPVKQATVAPKVATELKKLKI